MLLRATYTRKLLRKGGSMLTRHVVTNQSDCVMQAGCSTVLGRLACWRAASLRQVGSTNVLPLNAKRCFLFAQEAVLVYHVVAISWA